MSVKHVTPVLAFFAVVLVAVAMAADKPADPSTSTAAADKVDKTSLATTSTAASNDYGIPHNLMHLLSTSGTVVLGVVVVAALAALVMPLFGIRVCQVLGNCENTYGGTTASGYSNNMYQSDVYGQYPQQSYPASNTYQKRSVEYMGPVLQMLKTAYDRYGQNTASKNTL